MFERSDNRLFPRIARLNANINLTKWSNAMIFHSMFAGARSVERARPQAAGILADGVAGGVLSLRQADEAKA
jgi:hypothetical protein